MNNTSSGTRGDHCDDSLLDFPMDRGPPPLHLRGPPAHTFQGLSSCDPSLAAGGPSSPGSSMPPSNHQQAYQGMSNMGEKAGGQLNQQYNTYAMAGMFGSADGGLDAFGNQAGACSSGPNQMSANVHQNVASSGVLLQASRAPALASTGDLNSVYRSWTGDASAAPEADFFSLWDDPVEAGGLKSEGSSGYLKMFQQQPGSGAGQQGNTLDGSSADLAAVANYAFVGVDNAASTMPWGEAVAPGQEWGQAEAEAPAQQQAVRAVVVAVIKEGLMDLEDSYMPGEGNSPVLAAQGVKQEAQANYPALGPPAQAVGEAAWLQQQDIVNPAGFAPGPANPHAEQMQPQAFGMQPNWQQQTQGMGGARQIDQHALWGQAGAGLHPNQPMGQQMLAHLGSMPQNQTTGQMMGQVLAQQQQIQGLQQQMQGLPGQMQQMQSQQQQQQQQHMLNQQQQMAGQQTPGQQQQLSGQQLQQLQQQGQLQQMSGQQLQQLQQQGQLQQMSGQQLQQQGQLQQMPGQWLQQLQQQGQMQQMSGQQLQQGQLQQIPGQQLQQQGQLRRVPGQQLQQLQQQGQMQQMSGQQLQHLHQQGQLQQMPGQQLQQLQQQGQIQQMLGQQLPQLGQMQQMSGQQLTGYALQQAQMNQQQMSGQQQQQQGLQQQQQQQQLMSQQQQHMSGQQQQPQHLGAPQGWPGMPGAYGPGGLPLNLPFNMMNGGMGTQGMQGMMPSLLPQMLMLQAQILQQQQQQMASATGWSGQSAHSPAAPAASGWGQAAVSQQNLGSAPARTVSGGSGGTPDKRASQHVTLWQQQQQAEAQAAQGNSASIKVKLESAPEPRQSMSGAVMSPVISAPTSNMQMMMQAAHQQQPIQRPMQQLVSQQQHLQQMRQSTSGGKTMSGSANVASNIGDSAGQSSAVQQQQHAMQLQQQQQTLMHSMQEPQQQPNPKQQQHPNSMQQYMVMQQQQMGGMNPLSGAQGLMPQGAPTFQQGGQFHGNQIMNNNAMQMLQMQSSPWMLPGACSQNVNASATAANPSLAPHQPATSTLSGHCGSGSLQAGGGRLMLPPTMSIGHLLLPAGATAAHHSPGHSYDLGLLNKSQLDHPDRGEALTRYRLKRKTRHFEKTVRYATRQMRACKRPRDKGRFVKSGDPNEPKDPDAEEEEEDGMGEASGAADGDVEASGDDVDDVDDEEADLHDVDGGHMLHGGTLSRVFPPRLLPRCLAVAVPSVSALANLCGLDPGSMDPDGEEEEELLVSSAGGSKSAHGRKQQQQLHHYSHQKQPATSQCRSCMEETGEEGVAEAQNKEAARATATVSAVNSCIEENGPAVGMLLIEGGDDDDGAEVDSAEQPLVSGASNSVPSMEASSAQAEQSGHRQGDDGRGIKASSQHVGRRRAHRTSASISVHSGNS